MISSRRKSKMLNIYLSLLFFSVAKTFIIFVPEASSTLTFTYLEWTKEHDPPKDNGNWEDDWVLRIVLKWIDPLLLLEVLIWEYVPLDYFAVRKLPIKFSRVCIWVSIHMLLSGLYMFNRLLKLDKRDVCPLDVFVQMVSVLLSVAILVWSRVSPWERLCIAIKRVIIV